MKKHIAERFIKREIQQLGWSQDDVLPNGVPVDYIMGEALELSEISTKKEVAEFIKDYINLNYHIGLAFDARAQVRLIKGV